jgi:RND family efflux transporter MFP subunit
MLRSFLSAGTNLRSQSIASVLGGALLGLPLLAGCSGSAAAPKAAPKPVEVVVETPVVEMVTEHEEFTGRTVAVENIEIRARVSGHLEKVLFKDGEDVKAGQPLVEIDARPYVAEVERTKATVDQLQARLDKLTSQLERASKLLKMRSISQEDYDAIAFDRAEAQASLAAAVASRDLAELNLSYTRIAAKIDGRISRRLVDPGNLVQADVTALARIVSLDPIYAYFDVDERTVLRLQRLIDQGAIASARDTEIPIQVGLADEDDYSLTARFNFIDNQVDAATGTLLARAELSNPKRMLSPGLFVRLRVPIGSPRSAILIPEEALGADQGERYVYVVNKENKVEYRRVKTGWLEGTRRVIESGLSPDERVALTNLQRIRPGDVVAPISPKGDEQTADASLSEKSAEEQATTAKAGGAR